MRNAHKHFLVAAAFIVCLTAYLAVPPERRALAANTIPAASPPICLQLAARTATKIGSVIVGRSGILIDNEDAADIFWGGSTAVTAANGMKLRSGQSQPVTVTYQSPGVVDIYVYSVAGTTACAAGGGGGVRAFEGR